MEVVYLLFSIVSTFLTSSLLSLALFLRSLPLLFLPPCRGGGIGAEGNAAVTAAIRLYEGHVRHKRRKPVPHAFEYPVRYALVDLDRAPQPSHLSATQAREVAATHGPVLLLTIPKSVGYEQNPLSVYYCYDVAEEGQQHGRGSLPRLNMCIAEVTNTPWGERVLFIFSPGSDLVAKPLHVSPFMDMLGNWRIHADPPGEDLSIIISVQHPTLGNYFTATLHAKQVYSASGSVDQALYFWLMPHKVAVWIYWQALKLWWKNVSFLQHPRYVNPTYRGDALLRDWELRCSLNVGQSKSLLSDTRCNKTRFCVWSDAQWPWS